MSRLGDRFSVGAIVTVGVALVLRLLAIPLSLLRINPYSQADAVGFAHSAAIIGHGFLAGKIVVGTLYHGGISVEVYRYWGLLLSPFWLLPGPSSVYAHIGMALLGTLAAYNVYVLGRYYHSPMAGVLAALPIVVYPSFVFVQSSLLREAAILAGITTVAHLLITPPQFLDSRKRTRWLLAIGILLLASFLRYDNIPVYLFALSVGVSIRYIRRRELGRARKLLIGGSVGAVAVLVLAVAPRIVDYLAEIHRSRAQGRTAYLVNVVPTTVLEAIAFAPLGMIYFLFAPFPWMVENVMDVIVAIEALCNIVFFVAGVGGVRYILRRSVPGPIALIAGFLAASVLYGIADANVGTVVRHRQMFVWVAYVFGGAGIAQWMGQDTDSVIQTILSWLSFDR